MTPQSTRAKLAERPLLGFFLLSFSVSWILWIPLLYGHFKYGWTGWEGNSWTNPRTMLGMLGATGPAISAMILTYSLEGREGVQRLFRRMLLWRVGAFWWLVGLYAFWLGGSLVSSVLQLAPLRNIVIQNALALINIPVLIGLLQMPLLVGVVGEEVGWRGFALPRLLERHDPIAASVILALPWILWHAPLAVFPEWTGNTPLPQFLAKYVVLILPLSLVFTWFFQKTRRSLLLAVVFHRAFNLTFNAYSSALGLSEESGRLLMNGLLAVLWLWAAVLVVSYLRGGMKKATHTHDCNSRMFPSGSVT
jgi:membrane protease YdiL (CAAX protease family)